MKFLFTISPYLLSMVLAIYSLGKEEQPFSSLFYPFVLLLVCVYFLLLRRNKGHLWFGGWSVFCFIFGIFSIDYAFMEESLYQGYFTESLHGLSDILFPTPIIFRGIIPFIIFYFITKRISVFKTYSLNKKISITVPLLFCTYYFVSPLYYYSPLMSYFFERVAHFQSIYVSTVLISALLCAYYEYCFIFKSKVHLIRYVACFFLLLFLAVSIPVFIGIISGLRSEFSTLLAIAVAVKYYLKFIWFSSGALYILLFLSLQWSLQRRKEQRCTERK